MLSEVKASKTFSALLFVTGVSYVIFVLMLENFRDHVLLAPVDVKRVISRLGSSSGVVNGGGDDASIMGCESDTTPVSTNTNSRASFEQFFDYE